MGHHSSADIPQFDQLFGWFMRSFAMFEKSLLLTYLKASGIAPRDGAKRFRTAGPSKLADLHKELLQTKQPSATELMQFERARKQLMLIAEVRNDLAHFGVWFTPAYPLTTNFRVVTGAEPGNRIKVPLESFKAMMDDAGRLAMYFQRHVAEKIVGVEADFAPEWLADWNYQVECVDNLGGVVAHK